VTSPEAETMTVKSAAAQDVGDRNRCLYRHKHRKEPHLLL